MKIKEFLEYVEEEQLDPESQIVVVTKIRAAEEGGKTLRDVEMQPIVCVSHQDELVDDEGNKTKAVILVTPTIVNKVKEEIIKEAENE